MSTVYKNKKYLITLRGLPGAGKSTFVKQVFGKKANIVCPDELRLDYNGLIQTLYGPRISQAKQGFIWKKAYHLLADSINKNRITILDATSVHEKDLLKGYTLAKNKKVNFLVIDFSDVSLEECKARNKTRLPEYKRVDDSVLDRMYGTLQLPLSSECKFELCSHKDISVE